MRILAFIILVLLTTSPAFAGGNLGVFSTGKKTVKTLTDKDKETHGIKNLRRLTIDDLKKKDISQPLNNDEDEEDPWDDGADYGC